jgi:hypothetical protein
VREAKAQVGNTQKLRLKLREWGIPKLCYNDSKDALDNIVNSALGIFIAAHFPPSFQ